MITYINYDYVYQLWSSLLSGVTALSYYIAITYLAITYLVITYLVITYIVIIQVVIIYMYTVLRHY